MAVSRGYCYREVLPFIALVSMECILVGGTTLFKASKSIGMSNYVFVSYTFLVGTLSLLPFPFIIQRRRGLAPINFSILYKLFLIGVIGYFDQILGYIGISYASPTLSSIIGNLTPAFTFMLAIIFRMEKLNFRSYSLQAKIMGTIVSVTGATIVTLYQGPPILLSSSPPAGSLHLPLYSSISNWVIGGVILSAEYFLLSAVYIIQAKILKDYPEKVVVAFIYNLVGLITSGIAGLIVEKDLNAWKVGPGMEILAMIYMGFFGGAVSGFVKAWSLHLKGPVYVASFKPSSVVFAVVMGVLFLGDVLHVGSLLGTVIVAVGFYAVLWGKAKEETDEDSCARILESSSDERIPLLQNQDIEESREQMYKAGMSYRQV